MPEDGGCVELACGCDPGFDPPVRDVPPPALPPPPPPPPPLAAWDVPPPVFTGITRVSAGREPARVTLEGGLPGRTTGVLGGSEPAGTVPMLLGVLRGMARMDPRLLELVGRTGRIDPRLFGVLRPVPPVLLGFVLLGVPFRFIGVCPGQ